MRSNGIDEEYITGNADDFEKWCVFTRTVPYMIKSNADHIKKNA